MVRMCPELMEALQQANEAAAEKAAQLEAAIATCAAQEEMKSAQASVSALQETAQALAEADRAQAEAVETQLDEYKAALDALRCGTAFLASVVCSLRAGVYFRVAWWCLVQDQSATSVALAWHGSCVTEPPSPGAH